MQTFQPELLQGLIAPGFRQEAPRSYLERLRKLMEAIVETHPDLYPGEDDEYDLATANAVRDHFAHWGSGWYENDTFLLHAFVYDDSCSCGAWTKEADPRFSQIPYYAVNPEHVRGRLCTCDDGWSYSEPLQALSLPPNFLYKPSLNTERPLAVNWYKHLHRSASISAQLSKDEWREVIDACISSLAQPPAVAVNRYLDWPIVTARKQAFEEQLAQVLALSEDEQTALLSQGDHTPADERVR